MIVEEESPVAQQVNQMMQNFEMSIMEMEVKKAHPWDVPVDVTAILYVCTYDATRLVAVSTVIGILPRPSN